MYISKRKYTACIDLLIDPENISSLGDVSEVKDLLLVMAGRGDLFAPKQCCFAICALGVQIYLQLAATTAFDSGSFV